MRAILAPLAAVVAAATGLVMGGTAVLVAGLVMIGCAALL